MDEVLSRIDEARRRLADHDAARNDTLQGIRPILAGVRTTINLVQRGEVDEAVTRYQQVLHDVEALQERAAQVPGLWQAGAVENALQEVAEAWSLLRLCGADEAFPAGLLTPGAVVLGAADTVGELRRLALDALIAGDHERARTRLGEMESLYEALSSIDVARGVVDIKRKVDVARQLVDRTRGEVALGLIEQRMAERRT